MAASKLWRGIPMTAAMLRQLAQLRAETTPTTKGEASRSPKRRISTPSGFYRKKRT
jgi:hypothetical protein